MLKKFAVVGATGLLTAVAVAGTGAWSYVQTCASTASESVRDSMPIDWEIKRARQMISNLKPEIAENMRLVAREEVEVRNLSEQIDKKEVQLAKSRDDILRLKDDLGSGSVRYVYAGRSYSVEQVEADLTHRFKQFQVHEATTQKLSQVLSHRQKNLDAARLKLDEMLSAKRELEVEIENLQARQTMVEVAQASNPISIDNSQLSQTRQLLDDIKTRIDVAEQLVASEGALEGTIPLDEATSPDLLDEVAEYFSDEETAEIKTLLSSHEL